MRERRISRVRFANIVALDPGGAPVATGQISERRVQRSIFRILKENVLCSMATVTSGKRAHINTAYFCYSEELELYFLSHRDSLHCQNLLTNSSMAMTIFSSLQKWGQPDRGVQLFGTCREAGGIQARKAEKLYSVRFPLYAEWKAHLKRGDMGEEYRFFRFLVGKLKLLDEKEFGAGVFVTASVRRS